MQPVRRMTLTISGLGIVFYSPGNIPAISSGEDYLSTRYTKPSDVMSHITQGTLVGFGTGSPGTYQLNFYRGYPTEQELAGCRFKLRLGVHVTDGLLVWRDLYDMMNWTVEYDKDHALILANGFYHLTLLSDLPLSGVLGDNQSISIYLKPTMSMPKLKFDGVPLLCWTPDS